MNVPFNYNRRTAIRCSDDCSLFHWLWSLTPPYKAPSSCFITIIPSVKCLHKISVYWHPFKNNSRITNQNCLNLSHSKITKSLTFTSKLCLNKSEILSSALVYRASYTAWSILLFQYYHTINMWIMIPYKCFTKIRQFN